MVSVIICSRNPRSLDALKINIHETIGTKYELIIIDNSENHYSIFSAYNKGMEMSRYPYLCFIHEDILFHSGNWGKAVSKHLEDPSCGLIGVCGGFLLPRIPSSWSFYYFTEYILQSDNRHSKPVYKNTAVYNKDHEKPVIALDGVFLGIRKELFEKIRFDDTHYKGFHFYDTDICLQAYFQGFENRAVNDILIEHFSKGFQGRQWVENSLTYWKKWGDKMPVSSIKFSEDDLQKKEYGYMTGIYMKRMIRTDYSTQEIIRTLLPFLKHVDQKNERIFCLKMSIRIFLTRLAKKPLSLIHAASKVHVCDGNDS